MLTKQELRDIQKPIRDQYTDDPSQAMKTLTAEGEVEFGKIAIHVDSHLGKIPAGLHEATGGDGSWACSVDILLQSLVGCAGVTLAAVATSMELDIESAKIVAEADLDFRGTLGMDRNVPVAATAIRMNFHVKTADTDILPETLEKLIELTERYCVVFQSLQNPPKMSSHLIRE